MIKVYASIASVGFLVLAGGLACSSANTPDDEEEGGTGNSTAGTNSSSGSGVIPMGGNTSNGGSGSSDAGTSSTPTAGTNATPTAGTGSGGAPPSAVACKGIKTGMACMPEGQACPDLACGLADSGTRACSCETTWMCSSCDFTNSPFKDKPADITTCTNQADKLDCTGMEGAVCEGAAGGEVCACYLDDEGAPIWDCDKAPTTWAAAAM
jgi:hypothetical protein